MGYLFSLDFKSNVVSNFHIYQGQIFRGWGPAASVIIARNLDLYIRVWAWMVCTALIIHKLVLIFNSRYIVQLSLSPSLLPSIHALLVMPKCHLASRDLPCLYMYSSLRTAWSRGTRPTGPCFGPRQHITFWRARSGGRVCDEWCTWRWKHVACHAHGRLHGLSSPPTTRPTPREVFLRDAPPSSHMWWSPLSPSSFACHPSLPSLPSSFLRRHLCLQTRTPRTRLHQAQFCPAVTYWCPGSEEWGMVCDKRFGYGGMCTVGREIPPWWHLSSPRPIHGKPLPPMCGIFGCTPVFAVSVSSSSSPTSLPVAQYFEYSAISGESLWRPHISTSRARGWMEDLEISRAAKVSGTSPAWEVPVRFQSSCLHPPLLNFLLPAAQVHPVNFQFDSGMVPEVRILDLRLFTILNSSSIDFKNGCGGGFCILTAVCILFPSHVHPVSLAISAELRYAFFGLCFSISDKLSIDFNEIRTWSHFERYALWLARSGGRVYDERCTRKHVHGIGWHWLRRSSSPPTTHLRGRCLFVMWVTPPACDGPPCPLSLLSPILCRHCCL